MTKNRLPTHASRTRKYGGPLALLLTGAGAAAVAACSSGAKPDQGETVGQSSAALGTEEGATLADLPLQGILNDVTDFYDSTLVFSSAGPSVVFTPSKALKSFLPTPTSGACAGQPPTTGLKPFTFSTPCGTATGTLSSFNLNPTTGAPSSLNGIDIHITAQGVAITGVSFNASLAVVDSCANFDLNITGATVDTTLTWNPGLQEFQVGSVTASVPNTSVTNCLDGLCDPVVKALLPSLAPILESALTAGLNSLFSGCQQSAIQTALADVIAAPYANGPGGPWVLGPDNGTGNVIAFYTSPPEFEETLTHWYAPAPQCSIIGDCNGGGTIQASCILDSTTTPDPVALYQVAANGQYTLLTQSSTVAFMSGTTPFMGAIVSSDAPSETVIGCSLFPGGQTCDPAPTTLSFSQCDGTPLAPGCEYSAVETNPSTGMLTIECPGDSAGDAVFVFAKGSNGIWEQYQGPLYGGISNGTVSIDGVPGQSYTLLGCSANPAWGLSSDKVHDTAPVGPGLEGCDATATTVVIPSGAGSSSGGGGGAGGSGGGSSCGTPRACCSKAGGRYETSPPPAHCVII